jgi:hypothetical protein
MREAPLPYHRPSPLITGKNIFSGTSAMIGGWEVNEYGRLMRDLVGALLQLLLISVSFETSQGFSMPGRVGFNPKNEGGADFGQNFFCFVKK